MSMSIAATVVSAGSSFLDLRQPYCQIIAVSVVSAGVCRRLRASAETQHHCQVKHSHLLGHGAVEAVT